MSQIILDDQLFPFEVLVPIARWATVQRLRDVHPNEVIKDERVPVILRELRQPTFVTIDMAFWSRRLCDVRYCIVCFPLRNDEQHLIPGMLRQLLRLPEFHSKAQRMGKVIQVGAHQTRYWKSGDEDVHSIAWKTTSR